MNSFDYTLDYKNIDFRLRPDLYVSGNGEQGVLLAEPYKSEILPHWRFKTPGAAKASAMKIKKLFNRYKKEKDFAGMDMARKFIQMGYTRSRRYANHKSGKKYDGPVPVDKRGKSGAHGREILPIAADPEKAAGAVIFLDMLNRIKADKIYQSMRKEHIDNMKH